ncbi:hypothetical protein MKX03_006725 [Papaver bracteatum]|nr:hypothetical protein MKX03_006725 [Papaver bracteatum]
MDQQKNKNMVEVNIGEEEILHDPFSVKQLQADGVASVDVKKLKDDGLCTVQAVAYSPRKELLVIKGNIDSKVDKIDHRSSDEAGSIGFYKC